MENLESKTTKDIGGDSESLKARTEELIGVSVGAGKSNMFKSALDARHKELLLEFNPIPINFTHFRNIDRGFAHPSTTVIILRKSSGDLHMFEDTVIGHLKCFVYKNLIKLRLL